MGKQLNYFAYDGLTKRESYFTKRDIPSNILSCPRQGHFYIEQTAIYNYQTQSVDRDRLWLSDGKKSSFIYLLDEYEYTNNQTYPCVYVPHYDIIQKMNLHNFVNMLIKHDIRNGKTVDVLDFQLVRRSSSTFLELL